MSNRFKFRVWNNKMQKFHMVFSMHGIVNDTLEGYAKDDNFVLEQCTGLKDKNGKLIYEGDLIKIEDDVAEIKWSNYCAGFILESSEDIFDFETTYAEECKVIGNIHENADLFEVENE